MNLQANTPGTIFHHPKVSSQEIKLLAAVAEAVKNDTINISQTPALSGLEVITQDLGLSEDLILGNSYRKINPEGEPERGDANATVFKSQESNTIIIGFRATERIKDEDEFWLRMRLDFYPLFSELFDALNNYIDTNKPSKILLTGTSMGAAMVSYFIEDNSNPIYSAVTFGNPEARKAPDDSRILNIGYFNDRVYEIVFLGEGNEFNSTKKIFLALGEEHDFGDLSFPFQEHDLRHYVYGVNQILSSDYYDRMSRDSFIIIDRTDRTVKASDYYDPQADLDPTGTTIDVESIQNSLQGSIILGEDDDNDNLVGNSNGDILVGLGGNDTLIGENIENLLDLALSSIGGNDTLEGGSGNDELDGLGGTKDVAIFSEDFSNYNVTPKTIGISGLGGLLEEEQWIVEHKNGGIDGTDTLVNIERAEFNGVRYSLEGDRPVLVTKETTNGSDSSDVINGFAGTDEIFGGDGNDTITGDDGGDFLFGEAGQDRLWGGNGNDKLDGGDGNDRLRGQKGGDTLIGGSGNDTLEGQQYKDKLWGGTGKDKLYGGSGDDKLRGQGGSDTIKGGSRKDTLFGGDSNDKLYGNSDKDVLQGEKGNDYLKGGGGDDTLVGGKGSDTLVGGKGVDVFDVNYNDVSGDSDADIFMDYTLGEDKIEFSGTIRDYGIKETSDGDGFTIYHLETDRDVAILPNVSSEILNFNFGQS